MDGMPIVLALEASRFSITNKDVRSHYAIGEGILYFRNNVCKILVDSFEAQDEIDVHRAEEARDRANARLRSEDPNIDLRRAEIALKKALNRISVSAYRD